MKVYIFEAVAKLTQYYHCNGGLVVIAQDEKQVKELIAEDEDIKLTDEDWSNVKIFDLKGEAGAELFIFENAGCC